MRPPRLACGLALLIALVAWGAPGAAADAQVGDCHPHGVLCVYEASGPGCAATGTSSSTSADGARLDLAAASVAVEGRSSCYHNETAANHTWQRDSLVVRVGALEDSEEEHLVIVGWYDESSSSDGHSARRCAYQEEIWRDHRRWINAGQPCSPAGGPPSAPWGTLFQ